jgi:C1A family cysteine protease
MMGFASLAKKACGISAESSRKFIATKALVATVFILAASMASASDKQLQANDTRALRAPNAQASIGVSASSRNAHAGLSLTNRPTDGGASLLPGLDGAPTSYDSRRVMGENYVSSVKDQGNLGSCWTFATYGSMESGILRDGGPETDFSENHLVRNHGFYFGPNDGGNIWMSQAYLARLAGPVSEADDPYSDALSAPSPGGPRQRTFTGLVYEEDPTAIKNAIMNHGAAYTSMRWESSYYNSADATYYYSGTEGTNHGVTLVGWDDTKVTAASTDGAWLVKNSWGDRWGVGGYFWISYEDTQAGAYAAAFTSAPASKVNGVHTYSEFGDVVEVNAPYGANRFETGSKSESIGAVGFYSQYWDENYEIRIYDALVDGQGQNLLHSQAGTAETPGFQMVDLTTLLDLPANEDFVVVVGFPDSQVEYMSAVDYDSFAEDGWDYSNGSTANPGESFYSIDGTSWTDLTSAWTTANFAINAYTVPEPMSISMLMTGGLVLLRRRRRRRR